MKKTVSSISKVAFIVALLITSEKRADAQTSTSANAPHYMGDFFWGLRSPNDQNHGIKYDQGINGMEFRAYDAYKWVNGQNGATQRMILDGTGNLGIGVNAPSFPLDIKGRMRLTSDGTAMEKTAGIWFKSTEEKVFVGMRDSSRFGFFFMNVGWKIGMDFYTGYMGIGTMAPTEQLHVVGNSKMDGNLVVSGNIDANKNFNVNLAGANGSSTPPGNFQVKGVTNASLVFVQASTGRVGIGTINPSEKLHVAGKIKADAFLTDAGKFPDYVFADDYSLMPLTELETYINTYNKLPGMPSEAEVKQDGLELQKIAITSVEKIEELSLYMIAAQKHIEALQSRIAALEAALNKNTARE